MEIAPHIYTAKVMHKRLFPKVNQFTYGVYYTALPVDQLHEDSVTDHLPVNRYGALSFYDKDHGARNETDLGEWITPILAEHGLSDLVENVMLISMPRVLGYVFNPVSFWMCFDAAQQLRAVLCEVNNTFNETHSYVCMHDDLRVIGSDDILSAEKLFHVSPFLAREGSYEFRFSVQQEKLGIWIDYFDSEGSKQLITALVGTLSPLNKQSLRRVFWSHPLVTFKAISLIHWQALKLFSKGVKYLSKPEQRRQTISTTREGKTVE